MALSAPFLEMLASLGVYGTLAYSVSQRSRELAIRMAVGADARRLRRLVVGDGLAIAAVGLAIGLAGALGAGRLLQGLLFGVGTTDPVTYVAVTATVVAAVLVASWVPSRRATRVDPARVLHEE